MAQGLVKRQLPESVPSTKPPPYVGIEPRKSAANVQLNENRIKKSLIVNNGVEYQVIAVEIDKLAEIGMVVGHVEGHQWVFIDEILPNGMIDMHGGLKVGDYLTQAGLYSLVAIDLPTALLLIEKAYDEGRKTVSFVAVRSLDVSKEFKIASNFVELSTNISTQNRQHQQQQNTAASSTPMRNRAASSRAQSFVAYENNAESDQEDVDENDAKETSL